MTVLHSNIQPRSEEFAANAAAMRDLPTPGSPMTVTRRQVATITRKKGINPVNPVKLPSPAAPVAPVASRARTPGLGAAASLSSRAGSPATDLSNDESNER